MERKAGGVDAVESKQENILEDKPAVSKVESGREKRFAPSTIGLTGWI